MLIFERLEHLKRSCFFDANYLSDSLAIPKKKLRSRAFFFRIAHSYSHSHSHSLKVLRNENDPFPDSHSLRIKGNYHNWGEWHGRGSNTFPKDDFSPNKNLV